MVCRDLGFRLEFEAPAGGSGGSGVAAVQGDAGLTIFLDQQGSPVQSGQGYCTIQISEVEDIFARLSANGVIFISAPAKHSWGCGAVLADPDPHRLHLYDEKSTREKG